MDPRRPEIRDNGVGCRRLSALFLAAIFFSGAEVTAGLIALTNSIGGA